MPLPPRFTPVGAGDAPGLSSKPDRVLADAVKYHRAGTLDRAETLYRLLLERAGVVDRRRLQGRDRRDSCFDEQFQLLVQREPRRIVRLGSIRAGQQGYAGLCPRTGSRRDAAVRARAPHKRERERGAGERQEPSPCDPHEPAFP